jgi:endonuclease/exonuclease/phosphatase family metal-dependent hydrolase
VRRREAAYRDAELATMRCDYLLASRALAARTRSYQVIRNAVTAAASDHYPVLATFDVAS